MASVPLNTSCEMESSQRRRTSPARRPNSFPHWFCSCCCLGREHSISRQFETKRAHLSPDAASRESGCLRCQPELNIGSEHLCLPQLMIPVDLGIMLLCLIHRPYPCIRASPAATAPVVTTTLAAPGGDATMVATSPSRPLRRLLMKTSKDSGKIPATSTVLHCTIPGCISRRR